jgi:membrane protein required for colicin V production
MLTGLDWLLLTALGCSVLLGLWRGLVYEVLSVLGWVVSFYAAQWFAPDVAAILPLQSLSDPLRYATSFVLIFVASLFAWALVASLVKKLVDAVGLRPIDRVLGAVFGGLRGLILLLAATVVINMTALKTSDWWTQSSGAPLLSSALQRLKPLLPEQFVKYL